LSDDEDVDYSSLQDILTSFSIDYGVQGKLLGSKRQSEFHREKLRDLFYSKILGGLLRKRGAWHESGRQDTCTIF
jgi:hypothetical protein